MRCPGGSLDDHRLRRLRTDRAGRILARHYPGTLAGQIVLHSFSDDRWRNVYAGELDVRPPGAPTSRDQRAHTMTWWIPGERSVGLSLDIVFPFGRRPPNRIKPTWYIISADTMA